MIFYSTSWKPQDTITALNGQIISAFYTNSRWTLIAVAICELYTKEREVTWGTESSKVHDLCYPFLFCWMDPGHCGWSGCSQNYWSAIALKCWGTAGSGGRGQKYNYSKAMTMTEFTKQCGQNFTKNIFSEIVASCWATWYLVRHWDTIRLQLEKMFTWCTSDHHKA